MCFPGVHINVYCLSRFKICTFLSGRFQLFDNKELMHRYTCLFQKIYKSCTLNGFGGTNRIPFKGITTKCKAQADSTRLGISNKTG